MADLGLHAQFMMDANALDSALPSSRTGFGLRDEVLRGADWFNVQSFPDIIFRSQRFIFNEERRLPSKAN